MVAHLESMRSSYSHQLNLLQETIDDERETLRIGANRRWDELAERSHVNMNQKDKMERERRAFYEQQLERIKLEHIEATRAARIRMESDQQDLLVEMRQMKANCLLKSERFDYNMQILQKKGDENVRVRNQEKRKLAELREKEIELRKKIDKAKTTFKLLATKLTKEIERFHDSFMELEERAEREAVINEDQFRETWHMNQEKCRNYVSRVLAIDKVLYQQQLGLEWSKPILSEIYEPDLPSFAEAFKLLWNEGM